MVSGNEFLQSTQSLFKRIEADFNPLVASLRQSPVPQVDIELVFEPQLGLAFQLCLQLQGDELCLGVGNAFWSEWFPCSDPRVVAEFEEAVRGVLSGKLRVVEFYRKEHVFKAELQRLEDGRWRCVSKWTKLHLPSLSGAEMRVLQVTTPLLPA